MNDSKQLLESLLNDQATQEQIFLALQKFHLSLQQHNSFETLSNIMSEEQLTTVQFIALLDKRLEQQQAKLDLQLKQFSKEQHNAHAKLQALLITAAIIGSLFCVAASLIIFYGLAAEFLMLGSYIFSLNYVSALYTLFSNTLVFPIEQAVFIYYGMIIGSICLVDHKDDPVTPKGFIAAYVALFSYISLIISGVYSDAHVTHIGLLSPPLWTFLTWIASAGLYFAPILATAAGLYFLTTRLYDFQFEKASAQQTNDLSNHQHITTEKTFKNDETSTLQQVITELKITKETVHQTLKFGVFAAKVSDQPANNSTYYDEPNKTTDPAFLQPPAMSYQSSN